MISFNYLLLLSFAIGINGFVYRHDAKVPSECRKFTVDKCTEGGIYETVGDIHDVATCQLYCNSIFADHCTFFMLDLKQSSCMIMDQSLANYVSTCQKVVGPRTPSLTQCQSSADECDKFVEGYCQYEGNILEHFDGLDAARCQAACSINPNCQVFSYDGSEGISNCQLYGAISTYSCDLIRGPPYPLYANCL